MSLSQTDRCPHCGSPYMSSAQPGEIRYCYTCNSAGAVTNAGSSSAPAGEDLELQPLDDEPVSTSKRGIQQMAPGKRRAGAAPAPAPKPTRKAPVEARQPVRDEMPPQDIEQTVDTAAAVALHRGEAGGRGIPQIAPSAANFRPDRSPDIIKLVQSVVAICALGFAAWFFMFRKKPPEPVASNVPAAAPNTPPKVTPPPEQKKPAAPTTPKDTKPKEAKPASVQANTTTKTESSSVANAIGIKEYTPPKVAPTAAETEKKQDVSEILGQSKSKKPRAAVEEDDSTAAKTSSKDKKKEIDPAAPIPEPKLDVGDVLGNNDNKPEKMTVEKKENPFAPKAPVAVTATEPTVIPLDIERIGGNDKTFSQELQTFLPNWRVRDTSPDISKIGIKINGREQVIQLNPLNDTVPAKLMCTLEIPKEFASKRPMLLYEVSATAPNKTWLLSIRAMNVEMFPKQPVKMKRDQEWTPMALDLSVLCNKHFDLQIEVYAAPKTKKIKEEIGLIRNVRIEWTGMKPKPVETKKPDEKKSEEKKPDEPKPDDKKPDEAKPEETKPEVPK